MDELILELVGEKEADRCSIDIHINLKMTDNRCLDVLVRCSLHMSSNFPVHMTKGRFKPDKLKQCPCAQVVSILRVL
jgi:hypothetical protein